MNHGSNPTLGDARLDRLVVEVMAERADDVYYAALSPREMTERIAGRPRFGARRQRQRRVAVARAGYSDLSLPGGWTIQWSTTLIVVLAILALLGGALVVGAGSLNWTPNVNIPAPSPSAALSSSASAPPLAGEGPLEAGSYTLKSGDAELGPPIIITVPDGWGAICVGGCHGVGRLSAVLDYWTVDNVYADPCGHVLRDPEVGPSVDELADALAALPGTDATQPVAATIDGHPAKYLEVTVRDDIGCAPESFNVFDATSRRGWTRWSNEGFRHFDFWVLDVEGQRVLIEASWLAGTSAGVRAELLEIVESISFRT